MRYLEVQHSVTLGNGYLDQQYASTTASTSGDSFSSQQELKLD